MKTWLIILIAGALVPTLPKPAQSEDFFFTAELSSMTTNEAQPLPLLDPPWPEWQQAGSSNQQVSFDGDAEGGYIQERSWPREGIQPTLTVKVPQKRDVTGRFMFKRGNDLVIKPFRIPADKLSPKGREDHVRVMSKYYTNLYSTSPVGRAWFRYRLRSLQPEGSDVVSEDNTRQTAPIGQDDSELLETMDLFTGATAIAENLQLDRLLTRTAGGEPTIPVSDLVGIEVKEIDWKPLLGDKKPEPEVLSTMLPGDQFAVIFSSFGRMIELADQADRLGSTILGLTGSGSTERETRAAYQRQLCLPFSGLSRVLGPFVVKSVAITGSDPFLRSGSDIAIILDPISSEVLTGYIAVRQVLALRTVPGAQRVMGFIRTTPYLGVVTPDRYISTYMARKDGRLVVSNSLSQLKKILRTAGNPREALAGSDEYLFFRSRYQQGAAGEAAFLVVPDAAIRRWAGPAWRIGDSRRNRAAAVLAELQGVHSKEILAGVKEPRKLEVKTTIPDMGDLILDVRGVRSTTYGTLAFLTPVGELNIVKVTDVEASAYNRFRGMYQSQWREFFDPIAGLVTIEGDEMGLDLSVIPLIVQSDYRELAQLTTGGKMEPWSGDPHDQALFRVGLGLNRESELFQEGGRFISTVIPGLRVSPLAWLGNEVELYLEADPFWDELKNMKSEWDAEHYVEKNLHRLPVMAVAEVSNTLGLTTFLSAIRGYVETTAPGLISWSNEKVGELTYVKVAPNQRELSQIGLPQELALYYGIAGGRLMLTFNKDLIEKAMTRRSQADSPELPGMPWLASSAGFQLKGDLVRSLGRLVEPDLMENMGRSCRSQLSLLNDLRRAFPDRDPLEVWETLYFSRISCGGGGTYVWNQTWNTMESTTFGHDAEPRLPEDVLTASIRSLDWANLGVSFENEGLRAISKLKFLSGE